MAVDEPPPEGPLPPATVGNPATTPQRRRRRRRVAVLVAAAVALAGGAGIYADVSTTDGSVGQPLTGGTGRPAPPFSLPELLTPSRSASLAVFRGKPLVVNFWASWCFPCQTEMPLLEAAFRSEHGSVQFLGIDTDDTRSAAIAFLARTHVTYPSLYLPSRGAVPTEYGLVGLPITVFVSPTGILLGRHIGEIDAATLSAALRQAFGRTATT